ncbi:CobW family GTP-binding protein [Billgrantia saliphila]|uniref:CobW family GTP-binding protein n=1 Tax=Billgrantia saliphila TaxID=1848458 RepID=UPI000CE486A7|nr:GTP-binding protein [Halomonas saliphila]
MSGQVVPGIAVHLLCGFLGSGKTTRINTLIRRGELHDALFLVNDFGSLNIDAELIESSEGGVLRLSNGCACCGISGNLSAQLSGVRRWQRPPRQLVFEASGVARPRPLMQLFDAAGGYRLDRVELLVDLSALDNLLRDASVSDIVAAQLGDIDDMLINRWQAMTNAACQEEIRRITEWNSGARLQWLEPLEDSGAPRAGATAVGGPSFPVDAGTELVTRSVGLSGPLDCERLLLLLDAARPVLLRAKGFLRSRDAPEIAQLLQWTPGQARLTVQQGDKPAMLVLIGKGERNLERLAALIETEVTLAGSA